MFAQMIAAWGSIDILVNNAGLQKDAPLVEMSWPTGKGCSMSI
jgi:glucose 1-dehydrogenase